MSTPSTKKPEQVALLEVAASEKPEREEQAKGSARYASPRPFREWTPEQGQLLPQYAREVLGEGHRRASSWTCARRSTSAPF
ncbi:hypothetical protein ACN28S_08360 [Cystobacter fuscus]